MTQTIENKCNVPKLRFPEFLGMEEWKEQKLEEVASFSKGKGISKSDVTPDGKQPCIRYGELYTTYNETIENVSSYTDGAVNHLVLSKANDVIIPSSGETQEDIATASCVIEGGIALGGDLNIIRSKMNGVFLSYYLNSAKKKPIAQLSQGISVVHLYSSQLKKLDISTPGLSEQQKIADCLSSIDELINAQCQKIDALKTHKKGLMQQLFPDEGEIVPKLRFSEFRGAGEWIEKPLGEIGEFIGGGTPSKANDSYWDGNIPWISSSDISDESIHQIKISRFITKEAVEESATKLIPENSILLVSRVGVGKLAITKRQLCTSQDFTNFIPTKNDLTFLAYYLKTHKNKLLAYSQGMAIKGFTKEDISKLQLFFPSIKEQQKIANCLSSIDDLITAQTQKLASLKSHKKGLMQQLFPTVDEVNG